MADVDIVIVNYRSAAYTRASAAAVREVARFDGVAVTLTVVNNGDTATDLEEVAKSHGPVRIIHNEHNLGFGTACNLGAAAGESRFILFLNPDALLKYRCLSAMTRYLDNAAQSGVGIVGPAIEDGTGAITRTSSPLPGIGALLLRSLGLSDGFLPQHAHDQSGPVGQVMGAVLMIRRRLFEELGGFDRRFFLYHEDVDLCARAARQGQATHYLTDARAFHAGRVSSSQDSGLALALFLRSRFTYARLHFGRAAEALLIATSYLAELPLRLLRTVFAGKGITGLAVLRAYRLLSISFFSGIDLASLGNRGREC